MHRYALIALFLGAFGSSGCDKMPWSSAKTDDSTKKDDDKKSKDKKKSGDDDDDDDDKKSSKKKKSGDDDDDDDDKKTDKKKKGDDDDDDDGDSADGTGVKECDEYLKVYQKCIVDPAPDAAKKSLKDSIKTQSDTFKKSAATPQGKTALATSCQSLIDSTKKNCKK